ncbi:MAG: uroporphyrinogen decarboxylase [Thermoanaerobaculia bacterium]|nr:uroporphyrinogen decarboxylase [Thermoanaerobaculia bacterium]
MRHRFLEVCRGEAVDRPPVWLMRQAGRYLPEYRAIRQKVSFLELCSTPDLAAEVTVQPVDILGVDAAIIFADILLVLDAMGAGLSFAPGDGPRFEDPIRTRADVEALRRPDVETRLGYVFETLRVTRAALDGRVPVIGFAGSPWTLAAYAVEGGSSTGFPRLLRMSYEDPSTLTLLMDRIADASIDYLLGQVEAGAQAIQIFDTWGGLLSEARWRALAMPPLLRMLEAIPAGVPRIFYMRGSAHLLATLAELPAEVLSVDWRMPLDEVRERTGNRKVLQGNLDPCALLGPVAGIEAAVEEMIRLGSGGGHVVNLGHGILPPTPVDHARAFVAAAQRSRY